MLCMSVINENIWRHTDSHPARSTEFRFSQLITQTGMIQIIMCEGPTVVGSVICFQFVHIPQRINNLQCVIGMLSAMGHVAMFRKAAGDCFPVIFLVMYEKQVCTVRMHHNRCLALNEKA